MQLITSQNFNIQTCFSHSFWFFSLKCWFKGQIISRLHLGLPNAYKLMCFYRNNNGNMDVKFLRCDYFLVQRCMKLTLEVNLWSKKKENYVANKIVKALKINFGHKLALDFFVCSTDFIISFREEKTSSLFSGA